MDLNSRPPWSNKALGRLGTALRDGTEPPDGCPSYADVMLWHADLAAEVHEQIESRSWTVASKLVATRAMRISPDLSVSSRPKTIDTLIEKLRRRPNQQLNTVQDLAGVRIDGDLLLGEQMALAREIATHFGADEDAIHDLRSGEHAGYRGVHVWLRLPAGRVEIQIRTLFQSIWANLYEGIADRFGRGIRYGEPVDASLLPADVSLAEVEHLVEVMLDGSASFANIEGEWQQLMESDDPMRGVKIGTMAMGKAMGIAAMTLILKGEVSPAEMGTLIRSYSGREGE